MTKDERLELIDELRAKADAHRAEIARREAEREEDPFAMQDYLMAEAEGGRASLIHKSGDDAVLVFKTVEDATVPEPAPTPEEFTDTQIEAISHFVVDFVNH